MTQFLVQLSQDVEKVGQLIAANKDGTVRRTNRKKYSIGYAMETGKKGDRIFIFSPNPNCPCSLSNSNLTKGDKR